MTEHNLKILCIMLVLALFAQNVYLAVKKGLAKRILNYMRRVFRGNKMRRASEQYGDSGRGINSRQNSGSKFADSDYESKINSRESRIIDTEVLKKFIESIQSQVIICDGYGNTDYVSAKAYEFGFAADNRLRCKELENMLAEVRRDLQTRDEQMRIKPNFASAKSQTLLNRANLKNEEYVFQTRIAKLEDNLFAIFIDDRSEQAKFEKARQEFAADVSHELKTPTGAIALLAETIEDCADEPRTVKHFAERIKAESDRLTNMIGKLIELQKSKTATSSENKRESCDICAVADAAAANNSVQADAKNISLNVIKDKEDGIFVPLPEEKALTVLENLIENAIKYSPENSSIGISVTENENSAAIRVIDSGIGISQNDAERIFERFYRADPSRSRQTGGSGLGLSIVKNIVSDAGGTISVWSQPGEGSTFTVKLPCVSKGGSLKGDTI